MERHLKERLPVFLDRLGLGEMPMGIYFPENEPKSSLSPKPGILPTKEKELENGIDWEAVFSNFSCVIGKIWLARKKNCPVCFSPERFGCPGAAFWLGFMKPQTETIIQFVSSGIPGVREGEFYCDTPDHLRAMFEYVDPVPTPGKYCAFKPVSSFTETAPPEFVTFFTRPESLCGLHQLATFVTNDPEIVASPWSAACGSLVAWPMKYRARGEKKAVLGGWDPSARKFYKTDELSFTIPFEIFSDMLEQFEDSFLMTPTWENTLKKVKRSKKTWGEG